ncbi:MAG: hypothetical protein GX620_15925 [Chloroflexi bacterium]|nr:hypothetical protein [Chloroflexota bacterium]
MHRALAQLDPVLGRMYLGVRKILANEDNPERLVFAAHGCREMMEKLPQYVDVHVVAQRESLRNKVNQLEDHWCNATRRTKCFQGSAWTGVLDRHLARFLGQLSDFFAWYDGHFPRRRQEITATLQKLDTAGRRLPAVLERHNVDAWDAMRSYFQSVAHHLDQKTTISEFESYLDALERFLLDRLSPRTFNDLDALDDLICQEKPHACKDTVQRAVDLIRKRATNYEYFFGHLASPEWIEPLLAAGFFAGPPSPEKEGEGVRFPFWPESRYLVRVAAAAPEQVLDILLGIADTENTRVYEDMADAALVMPAHSAARLVPQLTRELKLPVLLLLPQKLGNLMAHLASGAEVVAALDLARDLLAIEPDTRTIEEESSTNIGSVLWPRPHARFDTWEYGQILREEMPTLVDAAGIEALELLCGLLEEVLRLYEKPGLSSAPNDYSYVWRPSIDRDDEPGEKINNLLVTAIRDAGARLLEAGASQVLGTIERHSYRVFQRIGLHFRRKWPQADPVGTARLLQDAEVVNDTHLWPELCELLRERFGELPAGAQEGYVALVEQGPTEYRSSLFQNGTDESPTTKDIETSARLWQYGRLIPIQEYLPDHWRTRVDALRQQFGDLEHPDLRLERFGWVGPTSPKSEEQIQAMSTLELADYLSAWVPSGDWMSPTPEGMGRILQAVVRDGPERFAESAGQFEGLDPTYLRGILRGFEDAAKQGRVFPWAPVIRLCHWIVDQPREILGRASASPEMDPDWGWARQAAASLLGGGFSEGAAEIPYELRHEAWAVLSSLTEDPEPTPEYEAQYGSPDMDPVTLSINTVRGEAMHGAIKYALWVRRHEESSECGGTDHPLSESMPEVRDILDKHLDPAFDPSAAVRSVYGQYFPWLVLLDPKWTSDHIQAVFPSHPSLRHLWDAAWDAYVVFCRAYDSALELLETEYARAIDGLESGAKSDSLLGNPDRHLAEHLMVFYWRGKLEIGIPSGLANRFFDTASSSLRAFALESVGRSLYGTPDEVPAWIVERLMGLWVWRCETSKSGATPDYREMAAFGWWFASAKLDDEWSLTQLKQVLAITSDVEADHLVAKRLAELAHTHPLDSIECLRLMSVSDPSWRHLAWRQDMRSALVTAMQSEDEEAVRAAEELINLLGAQGILEYRDLLPERR